MKIALSKIEASAQALAMLGSTKVPAVTSFKIARILKAIEAPMAAFNDARDAALRQHFIPLQGKPGHFESDPEKHKEHIAPLLEVEVDIPGEPLTLADLGNVSIEPAVIAQLSWCITL